MRLARVMCAVVLLTACGEYAIEPATSDGEDDEAALALAAPAASAPVSASASGPLEGWNVLKREYVDNRYLDGFSFEWDYFAIQDDKFTGIVGLVLADPRGRLGDPQPDELIPFDLMPSGLNAAVAGQFEDGATVMNFVDFGLPNTTASTTERAASGARDGMFTRMAPTADGALHLVGKTQDIAFDLVVRPQWTERPAPAVQTGTDVGYIPGEFWRVNMNWPTTKVDGVITKLATEEQIEIDGHGYRENSFGRWAFVLDGWDFAFVSDMAAGVQFVYQTYHKSTQLDFADVSFYDRGVLKNLHFTRDQMIWTHDAWDYDPAGKQCTDRDSRIVLDDGTYRVEADVEIGTDQTPLLSSATAITDAFVIFEHFPTLSGTIERKSDGQVVTSFAGQGGGEISYHKTILPFRTTLDCTVWGRSIFGKAAF